MGQKVSPISLRIGITSTWDSNWYINKKEYADGLHQDLKIRRYIGKNVAAGVSHIRIERVSKKLKVIVYASKPGAIVGRKGEQMSVIRDYIVNLTSMETSLDVMDVKKPETDAVLIASNIAKQIEGRVSYKKAMKRSMQSAMKYGALGIKVSVSGRLGGAEIARTEWYKEGRVPLHTLRANIGYAVSVARTTYGAVGVQVLVYLGEVAARRS